MIKLSEDYYTGPERRIALNPRRFTHGRRHRLRTESLVEDCRSQSFRRREDEEGFIEITYANEDVDYFKAHPHTLK